MLLDRYDEEKLIKFRAEKQRYQGVAVRNLEAGDSTGQEAFNLITTTYVK
jgi:hypothetical protein